MVGAVLSKHSPSTLLLRSLCQSKQATESKDAADHNNVPQSTLLLCNLSINNSLSVQPPPTSFLRTPSTASIQHLIAPLVPHPEKTNMLVASSAVSYPTNVTPLYESTYDRWGKTCACFHLPHWDMHRVESLSRGGRACDKTQARAQRGIDKRARLRGLLARDMECRWDWTMGKQGSGSGLIFSVVSIAQGRPQSHRLSRNGRGDSKYLRPDPIHDTAPYSTRHIHRNPPFIPLSSPTRLPYSRRRGGHESHRPRFPLIPFPFPLAKGAHLDQLSWRAQTPNTLSPIRRWYGDVGKLRASRRWTTRARMLTHIRTETRSFPSSTDRTCGAVVSGLCGPLVVRGLGHECAAAYALRAIVRALPARGLRHSRGRSVVGEYGTTATAAAPDYAGPQDNEDEEEAAHGDADFGAQVEGAGGWVE